MKSQFHVKEKGIETYILWNTEERSFVFKHGTRLDKSEISCLPAQAKSANRFFYVIFVVTELLFT